MTLSIIAKGAKAPDNAPVFGNLVYTDSLQFALRATSKQNAFDLSDNEVDFLVQNGASFNQNGLSNNSNTGGSVVLDNTCQFIDMYDYSVQSVVSGKIKMNSGIALVADYHNSNGCDTFLGLVRNGATLNFNNFFGAASPAGTGMTFSGGATGASNVQIPASHFVVNGDNTMTVKPAFIATSLKVDPSNGNQGSLDIYIKSLKSEAAYSFQFPLGNPDDFQFSPAKKRATFGNTPPNLVHVGGLVDDPWNNGDSKSIKEIRIDSRYFTADEIEEQYQATKKWLLAEGIVDISHWR